MQSYYDPTDYDMMMKRVGETMMDYAVTEKDDVKANKMCIIGSDLSRSGTLFSKKYNQYTPEEQALIIETTDRMGVTKGGKLVKEI